MKSLISFAVLIWIVFFVGNLYCQHFWKYPVTPGSEEWKKLKTESEIISVQQIPEDVLKTMTTEEVLQAWLDLPGKMEILAFSNMQIGFNKTRNRFNVVNELLNRKDAGKIIAKNFATISPSNFNKGWNSQRKGKFITEYALIEFLLSQPEILKNLTKNEENYLFEKAKKDLEIKKELPKEDFDSFWISSGLILSSRILEKENVQFKIKIKSQKELSEPIKRGEIISKKEFDAIYKNVSENGL